MTHRSKSMVSASCLKSFTSSSFVEKLPSLNVTLFLKKHVDRRIVAMYWAELLSQRKLDFCKEFRGISIQVHSRKNTQRLRLHQIGIHPLPLPVWRALGWFSQENGHQKIHEKFLRKIERIPIFFGGGLTNYGGKLWKTIIFLVEQQKSLALFEVLLDQAEWKAREGIRVSLDSEISSQPLVGWKDVEGMKSQCWWIKSSRRNLSW